MKRVPLTGSIDDMDNVVAGTYTATSPTTLNLPPNPPQLSMGYFTFGIPSCKITIGGRLGDMYTRIFVNGSWGTWIKI